jgi:hypothetical protein
MKTPGFKKPAKGLIYIFIVASVILTSCNGLPESAVQSENKAEIYPLYDDITIPFNIAPLNFSIVEQGESYITRISSDNGDPLIIKGKDVKINLKKWKKLLEINKNKKLTIDIYIKKSGNWINYKDIICNIAGEPIDKYVVYRYIQPLYTTYEDMSIRQRNLENFDVKILIDNRKLSSNANPHCINCHSFQDYNNTGNMQMHFRGKDGGTMIIDNNVHKKVNPKAKGLESGVVYPSWHPKMDLIAYSLNTIGQNFHTINNDKVEVMDSKSELALYDVKNNIIKQLTFTDDQMETFPYWSPDGKYLYFVSANYLPETDNIENEIIENYQKIKYDIYRMVFNEKDTTFSEKELIFSASSQNLSATFPRISPDGKYLLFTMGNCGNFHIWHKSSDLYLLNLSDGKLMDSKAINSPDVESYHSWSSNGKWIIFSSRRDDGSYTRLYAAYFDKNGNFHKPFVIPQDDPSFYKKSFKSFNIPEFITKEAATNSNKIVEVFGNEAEVATLKQ